MHHDGGGGDAVRRIGALLRLTCVYIYRTYACIFLTCFVSPSANEDAHEPRRPRRTTSMRFDVNRRRRATKTTATTRLSSCARRLDDSGRAAARRESLLAHGELLARKIATGVRSRWCECNVISGNLMSRNFGRRERSLRSRAMPERR